jgi:hypothetical protein
LHAVSSAHSPYFAAYFAFLRVAGMTGAQKDSKFLSEKIARCPEKIAGIAMLSH